MSFLIKDDLLSYMESEEIEQITDGDDSIIDTVIQDSEEFGAELLRQRYDVPFEYAKTGTDRNSQLLKQLTAIAIFYLSERLPTNILPEARFLAYERAEKWLNDVAKGFRMVNLKQISPETQTGFHIRYGNKKGNHY